MVLKDIPPAVGLRGFVQCYRIAELDFRGLDAIPVKFYPPKPENCLHFCLEGHIIITTKDGDSRTYHQPVLAGQYTTTFERSTSPTLRNFQIVFRGAALYQLLGIPASATANQHIEASAIFGTAIHVVLAKLMDAKQPQEMVEIADEFCNGLLQKVGNISGDRFNRLLQNSNAYSRQSIVRLADEASLSIRQFNRKFTLYTGVNPKGYQRITRFNLAYNLKNRYPTVDWLTISLAAGYHDYTHLTRDYREFTGMLPTQFHHIDHKSPEWILGLAGSLYADRCQTVLM